MDLGVYEPFLLDVRQCPEEVEELERAWLDAGASLADVECGVLLDDTHWDAILCDRESEDETAGACARLQVQ